MAKYLTTATEVYRVDTDEEVSKIIEEAKNASDYELIKYATEYKEKKSKGEVIDAAFCVHLHKKYSTFWEV